MLVHICCSVDSHYFLQKLRKDFPEEKLVGFFYDPNIHPYSEYKLRLMDVERSCEILGIELCEGEYDLDGWFEATKEHEDAPEKGERCGICFDYRFENSALKAKELGESTMTSTLLTSPKKSIKQLQTAGDEISSRYGVEFVTVDYRQNGGTQEQSQIAKDNNLYKQSYCGCIYALNVQRDGQKKVAYELLNPLSKQILPASIESKIQMYTHRLELEKQNKPYKIIKENFLNYRLLQGIAKADKEPIDAYIVYFSMLKQKKAKYKIEYEINNIHYLNRNNIRLMSLQEFNSRLNTNYSCVKELMNNAPKVEKEIQLRNDIEETYSTNPIVVLDNIKQESKYELMIEAQIFDDIKERLIEMVEVQ